MLQSCVVLATIKNLRKGENKYKYNMLIKVKNEKNV